VSSATVNRARTPVSLCLFFPSIPFGKAVPADDDLFPPIRPPVDTTAPLKADAAEEEEDTADADADAVTGDGSSDASEESDEVRLFCSEIELSF
jgi:hypothetical protein